MIEALKWWTPDWWLPNFQTLIGQLQEPTFDLWLLIRYALQALLTSLPLFLTDYVCGIAWLRVARVRLAGGLKLAAALGLGAACSALGIFLLGTLGRVTYRGVVALTVVQAVVGLWWAWGDLRLPRLRWGWLWVVAGLVVFVPDLMLPILEYDSTMYHMASARWYMEQHKTVYHEGIRFNAQPHMPVMLYMRQWWVTGDGNLVKLVNLEYLAMLGGVFAWMGRRYRVRWGLLAVLGLVFGSPIFGYIARQEYADLALTSWLTTGLCVLVSRGARLDRGRLAVSGLLLGAAAASKLQGLLVVACFVAVDLGLYLWRARDGRKWLERALAVGVPVVLVGLPWWVRGWRYTGSPFYPFLSDSPDVKALFQVNARYGVGRDLMAFLATPWNMITVEPERYADLFRFGPSCLVLLVVGLLAVVWRRKRVDVTTLVAVLGSLLFTVIWFRSGQVMRYEACLLPCWGLLLLGSLARLGWRGPWGAVVLLPLLLYSTGLTNNMVRYGVPPPVTWPGTQAVLNAVLPYYRATQAASRVVGKNEMVYTWFCDDIRAYTPGKSYGDWFGGYTYTWLGNVHGGGPKISEARVMLERLKASGFRYVIVDRQRAETGGTIYGGKFLESGLVKPAVPVPGTETVFDDGRYAVFRLI